MSRLLVIQNDADTARALTRLLERGGHQVDSATDGVEGLRILFRTRPDLVVLDLLLPEMDGWQVLSRIRDLTDVPVLVLTASPRDSDLVRALHGGADDYLRAPCGAAVLTARITALLRRVPSPDWSAESYLDGRLQIDVPRRSVVVDGAPVRLTPIEFRLLQVLTRNRGTVLSPAQLLDRVWDDPTGLGAERVKFAVLRLRRRLGWADPRMSPIESVRGIGYRYRAEPAAHRATRAATSAA